MILTGKKIIKEVEKGEIAISPFLKENVQPNSVNVRIFPGLYCLSHNDAPLDPKKGDSATYTKVPCSKEEREFSWLLLPGKLYLGSTVESTVSEKYVPMLSGVSSLARLGVSIHQTAGFGDIGWGFPDYRRDAKPDLTKNCTYPTWTLEITVLYPTIIRPYQRIGQVYFIKPKGELTNYEGRYHYQREPQPIIKI